MKYVGKIHTFRHIRTQRLSPRLSLGELLEEVLYKIENGLKQELTGPRNSGPGPQVRCQEIPGASGEAGSGSSQPRLQQQVQELSGERL